MAKSRHHAIETEMSLKCCGEATRRSAGGRPLMRAVKIVGVKSPKTGHPVRYGSGGHPRSRDAHARLAIVAIAAAIRSRTIWSSNALSAGAARSQFFKARIEARSASLAGKVLRVSLLFCIASAPIGTTTDESAGPFQCERITFRTSEWRWDSEWCRESFFARTDCERRRY